MKKESYYKEHDIFPGEIESVMSKTHIHWDKSKEQVWMELERKIEANDEVEPVAKTIALNSPWLRVAIAAGFALLIGIFALVKFYTKTIDVPAGLHSEIYLPDKSLVKLNAQSTLSFKPLAWRFSRTVKFEGEAYFDVQKGKQFEVVSVKGKTIVLGTTFNIYSRNNDYQVTCLTGKVQVFETMTNQEVILTPGQQAVLKADGSLVTESEIDTGQTLSWLNNKLSFTSVPLRKVFEEIGRQYGVLIIFPEGIDKTYTGAFIKDNSIENVLNLVCRPFDLKASRKSDNEYVINWNN